jgi:hypothetical protein
MQNTSQITMIATDAACRKKVEQERGWMPGGDHHLSVS